MPAAQEIARAADDAARRGFVHSTSLVFAPGIFVDGEALVAAVRKGAGARARFAGGLTGDELRQMLVDAAPEKLEEFVATSWKDTLVRVR